jgi:hypothetical protein
MLITTFHKTFHKNNGIFPDNNRERLTILLPTIITLNNS